ncbi:MAG: phosphatidylglycerophosphatase A [Zoogloeaceae bacterium]|jgi:phosphatidylglycerophosphatase A|nr:phosphatidylglycerophosphatase A [Zoogloeaceae bacterium]
MRRSPSPSFSFLLSRPAHFFALGCGSGLSPWAPGTMGTLFAWGTFVLGRPFFTEATFSVFLALAFVFGINAIHVTGRALREPDHGSIVWDEIVPFWGVLFMAPPDLAWQGLAFVGFRFFDIVKPQPARWFDQSMKNGLGVMMDDVVAAGYTLFSLAMLRWILA